MKIPDFMLNQQADSGFSRLESDPAASSITEYLTQLHDIYLPQKLLDFAADHARHDAYHQAVKQEIAEQPEPRVLHAGIGSALLSMISARAGARQVMICEQWPSLAGIYETLISENRMSDQVRVINKRFADLKLEKDLHARQNLLFLDCIDCGLLGYGIIPFIKYAQKHLLEPDARIIPARATIYALPIELRTTKVCGFDLSAFNCYRWSPAYEQISLDDEPYKALTDPFACFCFDFSQPPDPENRIFELIVKNSGVLNAIAFWFELSLNDSTKLCTGPGTASSDSWQTAVQYLDNNKTAVRAGDLISVNAFHNCQQIGFEMIKPELPLSELTGIRPAVSQWHFPMIADNKRNRAYEKAITRAVQRRPDPRVLDIGTGTGLLAMMAARAGADTVTACEMVSHMASLAENILAANGFYDKIRLIPSSSFDIRRPRDMKQRANVLVSETVDHSLLGEGFLGALQHAHAELLEDPLVIPAAATVYAVAIELRTSKILDFDLSSLNLLRLNHYTSFHLQKIGHRRLTHVFEAFRFNFYDRTFRPEQKMFEVPVTQDGYCNAVAFWYDLWLDEETVINTGPESELTAWCQAVNFFDQEIPVKKGSVLPITGQHDLYRLSFSTDPLECMVRGIPISPPRHPEWFRKLTAREIRFQSYTQSTCEMIKQLPREKQVEILYDIVQNAALPGFDRTMVSDLIRNLG